MTVPNEMSLWHGTSPNCVDAICQTNFEWRLCGKNGTLYGEGSYFARDASYSHGYADGDVKYVFLADVLVGMYTEVQVLIFTIILTVTSY